MTFLDPLLAKDAKPSVLAIDGAGTAPLATSVETAFDSKTRTKGLLGRAGLAADTALILAPCHAIHTFRMQFPIDAIFVARDGQVLKIRQNLGPARVAMAARAFGVIEMAAGEAARHGLRTGDIIVVRPREL